MSKVQNEHIFNAKLLADGMEKVAAEWPDRFFMGYFMGIPDGEDFLPLVESDERTHDHLIGENPESCGTAACALGWAPFLLGVPKLKNESWIDYGVRLFGLDGCDEWFEHMFHSALEDKGAEGAFRAANRIREFIRYHEMNEE